MRKLIQAVAAILLSLSAAPLVAHSATSTDIVAAGRKSLLVVDSGNDRVGLVDIKTGSVKAQRFPFTIESAVIYDDASGMFRAFGRPHSGGGIVLWSIEEESGTLTSVKTSATRVEAFVRNPAGRLFARLRDDHNVLYAGIVGNLVNILAKSEAPRAQDVPDVALSGADVVSASEGTVLLDGSVENLSLPLSVRKDRLWYETRLRSGWLVIDPMTGDIRSSRDGSSWDVRPAVGGAAFGTVMPYSVEPTSDGTGAYVVSTIGNVNDRRRLLSRIDASGIATPVAEFGKALGRLVGAPDKMWLVGGTADEPTIRFAVVTPYGIGPVRTVAWPQN
jgi:hypothetical protein